MTWVTAIASVAAAQQASAAGKYNQAVQERNAKVKEQEAEQAEKQLEMEGFDESCDEIISSETQGEEII